MFAQRMRSKRRSDLLRKELNETVDHARRAAGHAAEGVGAAVGPRVVAARETMAPKLREAANRGWDSTMEAFIPLSEAAQARLSGEVGKNGKHGKASKGKKKRSGRRWPAVGLLVAGLVTGAVAAVVLRQRREWEEQQLRELAEEADREQPPDFSQDQTLS